MWFSLKTHRELFAVAEHGEAGEAPLPIGVALGTLACVTVLVGLVSEVFVESVQQAALAFGMTPAFVGFIVGRWWAVPLRWAQRFLARVRTVWT
jgi:Ca2+:H+ antiporter